MGAKSKLKSGAAGDKKGKPPPVDSGMARSAGDQPGKPPAGHEICFLLRRLKINPVAVAFFEKCIFVNDVRPKRRKNNQVQRIVKRPAGVEREGRSEAEERPNEARRAARRGEIIAR